DAGPWPHEFRPTSGRRSARGGRGQRQRSAARPKASTPLVISTFSVGLQGSGGGAAMMFHHRCCGDYVLACHSSNEYVLCSLSFSVMEKSGWSHPSIWISC